jgi:hypothetical protein
LRRNCFIRHVIGGNIEGKIYGNGKRERRREQLLDDFRGKRRYWKLEEEALHCIMYGDFALEGIMSQDYMMMMMMMMMMMVVVVMYLVNFSVMNKYMHLLICQFMYIPLFYCNLFTTVLGGNNFGPFRCLLLFLLSSFLQIKGMKMQ